MASCIEQGEIPEGIKTNPKANLVFRTLRKTTPDMRHTIANAFLDESKGTPTAGQRKALEMLKAKWKEIVPIMRILCLSESNNITAMWNHYSDHYQGAVLEFSAIDELDSPFLAAKPVIYSDSPPSITSPRKWADYTLNRGPMGYEDLIAEYELTKTSDWSYEKEWRIVSNVRPGESEALYKDYKFYPQELTGLYLGSQCSVEDRDILLKLLAFDLEHVRAYETIVNNQIGKFVFKPI